MLLFKDFLLGWILRCFSLGDNMVSDSDKFVIIAFQEGGGSQFRIVASSAWTVRRIDLAYKTKVTWNQILSNFAFLGHIDLTHCLVASMHAR